MNWNYNYGESAPLSTIRKQCEEQGMATTVAIMQGYGVKVDNASGLPTPTEADVNKVWQVTPVLKETKTEETVIVPEQTLKDGQELEYNDKFVPGAQCVAVINGVEYRGEVVVIDDGGIHYVFEDENFGNFEYHPEGETFIFWNETEFDEVTAKLSVIEETATYDYNWAPGVKIPIPTAEDEGKILVVTQTEENSIIVPEQQVPADTETPLIDVDLTKFIVGNTVKVTVSANSETITETGVIEENKFGISVVFVINGTKMGFVQIANSLYTDIGINVDPNSTIELEYIEPNYEYQLQENGGGGSSDVLWPAMYEYEGEEIMATFVPEDVEPNTWCMVCGEINGASIDTCLPVLITSYGNYVLCNKTDNYISVDSFTVDGGSLLYLRYGGH